MATLSRLNMRDPRHMMRLLRYQSLTGSEAERIAAIAKSEGVSRETIKQSVRQAEMYTKQNERHQVDLSINNAIRSVMPRFEESMAGLLLATELVEVKDANTGRTKVVREVDKTTRLEANRIVKDIIVGTQPKGPIAEVNVNQTTQVANLSSAETTEERMDRLRKKAAEANLIPAEIAAVPEHIDRDEEPDEDDEDEEEE